MENSSQGLNSFLQPQSQAPVTGRVAAPPAVKEQPKQIDATPEEFSKNIDDIGQGYKPDNIDANRWRLLYSGIAKQETGTNPNIGKATYGNAPQGDEAYGLMQVRPSTAQEVGFSPDEIRNDPYANFAAGAAYLRKNYEAIRANPKIQDDQHALAVTIASYHAGLQRVLDDLEAGGDGVPDVSDGKKNTRDYTKEIYDRIRPDLDRIQEDESRQAIKVDQDYDAAQKQANAESGVDIVSGKSSQAAQPTEGQQGLAGLPKPLQGEKRKSFEDIALEADEGVRELLGLRAPKNYPGRADEAFMVKVPVRPGQAPTSDDVADAIADTITGIPGSGKKFRDAVGENPGKFQNDITQKFLETEVNEGRGQLIQDPNNPDLSFIQLNLPVQNYIKQRLEAFQKEGAEGVKRVTAELDAETTKYKRQAAEELYGKQIAELRQAADDEKDPAAKKELEAQATALQMKLDTDYPVSQVDEVWKGIRNGLANAFSQYQQIGLNIKNLGEAVLQTGDKMAIKQSKERDRQFQAAKAEIAQATPEVRTILGNVVEALTQAGLVDAPLYAAGGVVLGPSGLVYTTALRGAEKNLDDFTGDIAAALIELPFGTAGKTLIEKTGAKGLKQKLIDIGFGGLGEVGGDATVDFLRGKEFDAKQALINFVSGGAFEIAGSEGKENEQRVKKAGQVQLRSPLAVSLDENGNPRYQAMVKVGDKIGLVEIPPNNPIAIKYAKEVAKGNLMYMSMSPEDFDSALTEFAGDKVTLPKFTVKETENLINKGDAENDSENVTRESSGVGVGQAAEQAQSEQRTSGKETGTSGVLQTQGQVGEQQEGIKTEGQKEEGQEGQQGEGNVQGGGRVLEIAYAKLGTSEPKQISEIIKQSNRRYVMKNTPEEQQLADDSYDRVRRLTPEENAALSEVLPEYFYAPVKQPEKGKRGSYSRPVEDIPANVPDAQLDANLKRLTQYFQQRQTETAGMSEEDRKSIAKGTKKVKERGVEITLPDDLAQQWEQADIDERKALGGLAGSLDEKAQARKDIAKQKKAKRAAILQEYQKREEQQLERGKLKSTGQPVRILSRQGDTATIAIGGQTKTVLVSDIETRKEAALTRTKRGTLPVSIRAQRRIGYFSGAEPKARTSNGVVYINDATESAINDALGTDVGSFFTYNKEKIEGVVKKLRAAGLDDVANQIMAQSKKTGNVPVVNVEYSDQKFTAEQEKKYKEEIGVAKSHEQIHTVALNKRLSDSAIDELYAGSVGKLVEESPDTLGHLNPSDVVQEVIAYGLTGDYANMGVSPDSLYDAVLDVTAAYLEEFPEEDLNTIAEYALINFDSIKGEAKKQNAKQEGRSEKEAGRNNAAIERAKEVRGQKPVAERLRAGTKQDAQQLKKEVKLLSREKKAENFNKWFKGSEVTEDGEVGGEPMVMYHATTHDFPAFDLAKTNVENYIGQGFYFTTNPADAAKNYSSEGTDITRRIDKEVERIQRDAEYRIEELENERDEAEEEGDEDRVTELNQQIEDLQDDGKIREMAAKKFQGGREVSVIPAYLSAENLFDVSPTAKSNKRLDYDLEYNEETEEYGEPSGSLVDFMNNMETALSEFVDYDKVNDVMAKFQENLSLEPGMSYTHKQVFEAMNDAFTESYLSENLNPDVESELYDKYGDTDFVDNEIKRKVIQASGFDGFKMGANVFSDRMMEGVDIDPRGEETEHVVVWKPEQIKSPYNKGSYSKKNADFLKAVKKNSRQVMRPVRNEEGFFGWFGNSKVRYKNNTPKMVYHGTNATFDYFDPNKGEPGRYGAGFYFTEVPEVASGYSGYKGGGTPNVIPAYIRIENPATPSIYNKIRQKVQDEISTQEDVDSFEKDVIKALQFKGYDGIIIRGEGEGIIYVVFGADQIKSPFNQGTYSSESADFLKKVSGRQAELDRINRKSAKSLTADEVKTVIEDGNFALMTAEQRKGETKIDQSRLDTMRRQLERQGYKVFDTDDGRLLVVAGSPQDIPNLIRQAARFKQETVTVGSGGTYRIPSTKKDRELINESDDVNFGRGVGVNVNGEKLKFELPDIKTKSKRSTEEINRVKNLSRAFIRSFKNRAQSTSADLIQWLGERMEKGGRKEMATLDTAKFLESTTKEMYGDYPNQNKMTKEEYDVQRTRRAVRDGLSIIKAFNNRTNQESGQSWYNSSIEAMHAKTGQAFPEINTVPQLRALFDVTLAMSSQGNKVQPNYNLATDIWRRVVEEFGLGENSIDGKIFPTAQPSGKAYGRFDPQLEKFNYLSQGYVPIAAADYVKLKKQGSTDIKMGEGFGADNASRGYVKDKQLQAMIDKYGRIGGVFEYLLQPGSDSNNPYKATEVLGPKIGAFFLNIAGFHQLVTIDMWASRWFYRVNGGLVNDAETNGMQDTPKNSTDGDIMRGTMQAIADKWNEQHANKIAPSDVQAILWYGEKDIWHKAGAKDSGQIDFSMAADRRIPEIVTDVDGVAKERKQVIDNFIASAPQPGLVSGKIGAPEASEENRQFFVRQMALPARLGLAKESSRTTLTKNLIAGDQASWSAFAEKAAGRPLDANESSQLMNLVGDLQRANSRAEKDSAIDALSTFADELGTLDLIPFFLNVRKAGLLSGAGGIARDSISNLAFGMLKEVQRGIAAPIDMTLAAMQAGRERTVQGVSPRGVWYAAGKGFTDGWKAFKDTITKGNTGASFEAFNLGGDVRSGYKWLDNTLGKYATFIFRLRGAGDALFRTYAYNRALYEVAALSQKNGGRPIQDVLTDPTLIESDIAMRTAEMMTFQNDNAFNSAYQKFKANQPGWIKYYLDYKAPFVKTGSNIFKSVLDYAILGGVYDVTKAIKETEVAPDLKGWEKFKTQTAELLDKSEGRELIVNFATNGLMGMAIMTAGYFLAKSGLLFGADDDDEKERRRREALGAGPGHIKVGERWYDIRQIAPLASILIAGASAYRANTKKVKTDDQRINAFSNIFTSMVLDGLPLARQTQQFLEPSTGAGRVAELVNPNVDSVIPAFVKDIAQTRDRVKRETKGDTVIETEKNKLKSKIPGLRETLPAKEDTYGQPVEAPVGVDPFNSRKEIKDPAVIEAADVNYVPNVARQTDKKTGAAEPVSEYRERKTKTLDLIKRSVDEVIKNTNYQSLQDKDEKKEALELIDKYDRHRLKKNDIPTDENLRDAVDALLKKYSENKAIEDNSELTDEEKKKAKGKLGRKYADILKEFSNAEPETQK